MFSCSSQLKFWTYSGTTEINRLRVEANQQYLKTAAAGYEEEDKNEFFLTPEEETKLRRHYEYVLKEFCTKFQPPMPKYVLFTSMVFFKRFYLHNSVIDYHPKDIVYTCVYLACKVEEFNVSIMQFVANLRGDREKAADLILSQELLLMQQLHYHLTVHNPLRPVEGLLMDIKTRCAEMPQAECLRQGIDDFLDRSLHTDICLIFAPSQISLAAVLHSSSKQGYNLDSYMANKLLAAGGKDSLMKTVEHIKRIRTMVKNIETLNREEVRAVERKLEGCRNQVNNPESDEYRQRTEDLLEAEDDRRTQQNLQRAEEQQREIQQLIGL